MPRNPIQGFTLLLVALLLAPMPAMATAARSGHEDDHESSLPRSLESSERPAPGASLSPYVIVTDAAFAGEFQELARFHSNEGLAARLRTTAWIRAQYPTGRDLAESIRLFLKDAHQYWGARFVLLGGDDPWVPMRRAHIEGLPPFLFEVTTFELPTDRYYACLDGDWNADGDELWGEASERPDDVAELAAGRAPVTTAAEAKRFVDRTRSAFHRASRGREMTALFVGASGRFPSLFESEADRLFTTLDTLAENRSVRLYADPAAPLLSQAPPAPRPLDMRSFERELRRGPDLFVLAADGDARGVQLLAGQPPLAPSYWSGLEGARSGLVIAIPGFMTTPAVNSAGRAMLLGNDSGAEAVIGGTSIHLIGAAASMAAQFMANLYTMEDATLGAAWNQMLRDLWPSADPPLDDLARLNRLDMTLLGDPALPAPGSGHRGRDDLHASRSLENHTTASMTLESQAGTVFAHDMARVQFAGTTPGTASLVRAEVLDLSGRHIRTLPTARATSNGFLVEWDLRDDQGVRPAKGLYFVRLTTGSASQVRRVVVD